MIAELIIAGMLAGVPAPAQPAPQRDTTTTTTTTTEQKDEAPRRKINVTIKLPGLRIPLYV